MHFETIICGACSQPASLHPIELSTTNFDQKPCPRLPETIGYSEWTTGTFSHTTIVNNFNTKKFYKDPEFIEALNLYDHHLESYRRPETVKHFHNYEVSDYVVFSAQDSQGIWTHYAMPPQDHSGPEDHAGSDLIMNRDASSDYDLIGLGADEAPYVSPFDSAHEFEKVARWNDGGYNKFADTWICTSRKNELRGEYVMDSNGAFTYLDPRETIDKTQRNAYVESTEGFLSVHLLDEQLTRKYGDKLLNIYLDKNTGDIRVGGVRLTFNQDTNQVIALCVNSKCRVNNGRPGMIGCDLQRATRQDQEDFIWAVISHGNNHSAEWFHNDRVTKDVHSIITEFKDDTIIRHLKPPTDSNAFYELATTLSKPVLTPEDELQFLLEHSNYCSDSKCSCSEHIKDLVNNSNAAKPTRNTHKEASSS